MSTDLHTLTGAYAVHALTAEEAEQFKTHLEDCPSCQQEVRELEAAAAQMGSSEAAAPPTDLKARVMAAADKLPQLPPVVGNLDNARPAKAGRMTRWTPPVLAAAAAVVLMVAAGIGFVTMQQQDPEDLRAADVVEVFEADDARVATLDTANGGEVSVATSASLGEMAVDTDELPALSEEQVYQLWAIRDGTPESVAVLGEPERGASMSMPDASTSVAITVEPAGGSEQPTTEPIVAMNPSEV